MGKQKPYSSDGTNGNLTAQFDKTMNGTTKGNLAFVLNRPQSSLWLNPLARVLNRNASNKSIQWQFGNKNATPTSGTNVASSGPQQATGMTGQMGAAQKPPAGSGTGAGASSGSSPAKPPAAAAPAAPAKPAATSAKPASGSAPVG